MSHRILIVDDELNIREGLKELFQREGYEVSIAGSGEEALRYLNGRPFEVVVTDLKMPGLSGVDLLRKTRGRNSETVVILITAYGTVESAVEAMKEGAYDYISKPLDLARLKLLVRKGLERRSLVQENKRLRQTLEARREYEEIIGRSALTQNLLRAIEQVADTDSVILLRGESGTGKELAARTIHRMSPQREGPFIAVNCGGLPDTLFESELLGYEKGAFTDAREPKPGRFELADGGTLFLDEVAEMAPKNQVNFLRVLQDKEFHRLGGTKLVRVNFRLIAASNRNLEEAIAQGRLREDFFYRLNVVPLVLPPLREHPEDVPLLAEHFLAQWNKDHPDRIKKISPEAMQKLLHYRWPGNVRELKNIVERVAVTTREEELQPENLPPEIFLRGPEPSAAMGPATPEVPVRLDDVERQAVEKVLRESTSREEAAKKLGISLRTLHYKLKRYGLGK